MAVEVIVKNKEIGLFKRKKCRFSYGSLIKKTKGKYDFSVRNIAMVTDDYQESKGTLFEDVELIIQNNESPIGRGFSLHINQDQSEYHLTLHIPATTDDCISFYKFLYFLLEPTSSLSFIKDDVEYKKSDIEKLKNNLITENYATIKAQNLEGSILFGSRYPILLKMIFDYNGKIWKELIYQNRA